MVKEKDGVTFHTQNYIIDGIIEGGPYGLQREYAKIDDRQNKEKLDKDQAVLDNYYFLLHIPFNSSRGILIIQSYTELSIQGTFKKELKSFFYLKDKYFALRISNYVPKSFKDKYERESSLRMFKFSNHVLVSDTLREGEVSLEEMFKVNIEIIPVDDNVKAKGGRLKKLYERIEELLFEKNTLGSFKKKKVFVKNDKDRKANYDIEKQISDIKPTIYLKDMGVHVNEETGFPDMADVKKVSSAILNECLTEIRSKRKIDEL